MYFDRAFVAEQNGRRLYAYATDGAGKYHFYHDANDFPLALALANQKSGSAAVLQNCGAPL